MVFVRKLVAVMAALTASITGLVVVSPTADASITICNTVDLVDSLWTITPVYYETYRHSTADCDFRLSETYNPAARQLQRTLNLCYGPSSGNKAFQTDLQVDGHYGPRTRDAVANVQAFINANFTGSNLQVDGYAGPQTRQAMEHQAQDNSCQNAWVPIAW